MCLQAQHEFVACQRVYMPARLIRSRETQGTCFCWMPFVGSPPYPALRTRLRLWGYGCHVLLGPVHPARFVAPEPVAGLDTPPFTGGGNSRKRG